MDESKIKNPLPVPEYCDKCCSLNVVFVDNNRIYGRSIGEWPKIYLCEDCGAAVGCHNGTNIPLGLMADRKTRKLRKKVHAAFDPLWRDKYMSRDDAYRWLANQLGLADYHNCHISQLSVEQLQLAADISSAYILENGAALLRRRKKKDAKHAKRIERERKAARVERNNRQS